MRTFRVGVSSNEFLPSPLESFLPIVSKASRNDWQIRICQLTKCLVDFRGRPFDFWGGYGWFQKKMSCRLISGGKKHANKFLGKNILLWKKYRSWRIMLKKNLTPLYVREQISYSREVWEKILPIQTKSVKSPTPHSPTNVQWSCQPFRGWGKKRIWHLCKCHPSTKWLARDHDVVGFKTKVLH